MRIECVFIRNFMVTARPEELTSTKGKLLLLPSLDDQEQKNIPESQTDLIVYIEKLRLEVMNQLIQNQNVPVDLMIALYSLLSEINPNNLAAKSLQIYQKHRK